MMMGITIDLHIYDKDSLLSKLVEWGADDDVLAMEILSACGHFYGSKYILLNNEYSSEYSPYYNAANLFDAAFKTEGSFDVFLFGGEHGISYVDAHSVAEELGIKLVDSDD
jgi:hypothetical protein